MTMYIREGCLATFARLSHIQHLTSLEAELAKGMTDLLRQGRRQQQRDAAGGGA